VTTKAANSFVIESVRPGGRLEFQWTRPAYIAVKLQDQGLAASSEIHAIVSGPDNLPTGFFDGLAESWRGWSGTKDWASYERDLEFAATSDGKGHVFLRVKLAAGRSDDQWRAQAELLLEAGQLEPLANQFRAFAKRAA